MGLLSLGFAAFYGWIAYAMRRRIPAVRIVLIVGACIGLLSFPIGTTMSIFLLVYMLKDGMPVLFSPKRAEELTDTEIAWLHEVHEARSGVWFIRVTAAWLIVCALILVAVIGFGGRALVRHEMAKVRAEQDLADIDYAVRDAVVGTHRDYPPSQRIEGVMHSLRIGIPTEDPWGGAYRYARTGHSFRVGSAGPDGEWTWRDLGAYDADGKFGDDIIVVRGEVLGGG